MTETKKIYEEIEILPEVNAKLEKGLITMSGPKGEAKKDFHNPLIQIELKENKLILTSKRFTKREKKLLGTFRAHIKNLMKGALEGHTYKLKICSSHFPMNVALNNGELIVKNFFGGKHPRKLKIKTGAEVKVAGSDITIYSCSKETAGQVAADIESLTRITNKDRRIFQDGIYIIEKDGKKIR